MHFLLFICPLSRSMKSAGCCLFSSLCIHVRTLCVFVRSCAAIFSSTPSISFGIPGAATSANITLQLCQASSSSVQITAVVPGGAQFTLVRWFVCVRLSLCCSVFYCLLFGVCGCCWSFAYFAFVRSEWLLIFGLVLRCLVHSSVPLTSASISCGFAV